MTKNGGIPAYLKEMGGVFKFGQGFIGKSTIGLVSFIVLSVFAICRLPWQGVLVVFFVVVAICIGWFFCIRKFSIEHPLEALLEGSTYSEYKQFEMKTKVTPLVFDIAQTGNPLSLPKENPKELLHGDEK